MTDSSVMRQIDLKPSAKDYHMLILGEGYMYTTNPLFNDNPVFLRLYSSRHCVRLVYVRNEAEPSEATIAFLYAALDAGYRWTIALDIHGEGQPWADATRHIINNLIDGYFPAEISLYWPAHLMFCQPYSFDRQYLFDKQQAQFEVGQTIVLYIDLRYYTECAQTEYPYYVRKYTFYNDESMVYKYLAAVQERSLPDVLDFDKIMDDSYNRNLDAFAKCSDGAALELM